MSLDFGSVPDWIAVGFLAGGGVLAVWKRKTLQRWWSAGIVKAKRAEKVSEADRLTVIRSQVLEVALAQGLKIAATSTGAGNPTVVTFSDGDRQAYYLDFQAYKRGMLSNPAGFQSTHHVQRLPVPVSRWDQDRCQAWLDEHSG